MADLSKIYKELNKLEKFIKYDVREIIGKEAVDHFTDNFDNQSFDGNKWNLVLDVVETSFQYGFEDGKWVPDNTINYTFLSADYDTVKTSTELANNTDYDFTAALGNINTYGNFNRNNGSTHWSNEMMVEAIAVVLNKINSNALDGQKYAVTVSTYGPSQTETFKLIKESGTWKANN